MAAMSMAIVLLLLAVGVQASRPYPEEYFASTDHFRKPWPTHNPQTNFDDHTPQSDTIRFTRPRTTEYNYDTINKRSEEFETLARASAYEEAQQLKLDREMQKYTNNEARNEYPKVLSDGTEILWMTGPQKTSDQEVARLDVGKSASTSVDVDPALDHVDSSEWEDGLWGTKHRPGAEHSLQYVEVTQPDGTTVSQSFNNP